MFHLPYQNGDWASSPAIVLPRSESARAPGAVPVRCWVCWSPLAMDFFRQLDVTGMNWEDLRNLTREIWESLHSFTMCFTKMNPSGSRIEHWPSLSRVAPSVGNFSSHFREFGDLWNANFPRLPVDGWSRTILDFSGIFHHQFDPNYCGFWGRKRRGGQRCFFFSWFWIEPLDWWLGNKTLNGSRGVERREQIHSAGSIFR